MADLPPVAGAVAEREGAQVEVVVALRHGEDVPLALVVLSAAAVRLEVHSQLVVRPGVVARPAPLRAGGDEGVLPAGSGSIVHHHQYRIRGKECLQLGLVSALVA